ncbi:hypothetical protein ACU4GR_28865 [Methylobacterium oryzae CBMB20]
MATFATCHSFRLPSALEAGLGGGGGGGLGQGEARGEREKAGARR